MTKVINLYGGPGIGKSTCAAILFSELKKRGISCELVTEYAKDLVWEQRNKTLEDQIYIFAKQHHRIHRLMGQVDYIVTDSPILLSLIYDESRCESLRNLVLCCHASMETINILMTRAVKYSPEGRYHTEEESKKIDLTIRDLLINLGESCMETEASTPGMIRAMREILKS